MLNLSSATKQDVFDYVVLSLIIQGRPSITDDIMAVDPAGGICRYRSTTDDKQTLACGAGHLISDREYGPEFEGTNIRSVMRRAPHLDLSRWVNADEDGSEHRLAFVTDLQKAHDVWEGSVDAEHILRDPARWLPEYRARARQVAAEHYLDDRIVAFRETPFFAAPSTDEEHAAAVRRANDASQAARLARAEAVQAAEAAGLVVTPVYPKSDVYRKRPDWLREPPVALELSIKRTIEL